MSGLVQFIVNIIAILAAGGIFFVSIDKVAPDPFFAKIAKIAIGALLLIALVVTIAGVFGLSGAVAVSPLGVVYFAIAVIVAVVILYVVNMIIDWIGAQMSAGQPPQPPSWVGAVKYVLGAIVLIGLLVAAADLLFGVHIGGPFPATRTGALPSGKQLLPSRQLA
jgi:hypothetical protein